MFCVLAVCSIFSLPYLKFSFDFEKFFPDNDPDLEFYKEFIEEFESDDNYLLIALANDSSIFSVEFLNEVRLFTDDVADLESILGAISLPTIQIPKLGPFGFSFVPLLNANDVSSIQKTIHTLRKENGLVNRLVSRDLKSTAVAVKIKNRLQIHESKQLMLDLKNLLKQYSFQDFHFLGRPYFQDELSSLQVTEVIYSALFSFSIVSVILFLLYRNKYLTFITLVSITLSLILFMGTLSLLGRELDAISALYPVLMLIVGSSDVIHILSKYLDELRKNKPIGPAMNTTIREIGLATFFTSVTTAIGFLSLVTSRIGPVREFGVNAAIGVLVAYITIIFFTTALLTYFSPQKLKIHSRYFKIWDDVALWFYAKSKNRASIYSLSLLTIIICGYGITKISTDYKLESSLPLRKKVTEDFQFFEKNYSGYRPIEYVFYKKNGKDITDYKSISNLKKFENKILESPYIESSASPASIYGMISNNLRQVMNETVEDRFVRIKPMFKAAIKSSPVVLLNDTETKARISAQIKDVGANKIEDLTAELSQWFNHNLDTSLYAIRYTGTGLVIDKNAQYVRESLVKGLAFALLVIGILMGILFRDIKMVFLSFIPNAFPLLVAGAILGYGGIPLEPLTSIIFVVIFGIAVDDTIHFLSKYRLALHSGLPMEAAIKVSFQESGKAIIFTTIVLFFGFMVMLFSYNPSSVIVGGLISITLFTAVFADLILLPFLLRKFMS